MALKIPRWETALERIREDAASRHIGIIGTFKENGTNDLVVLGTLYRQVITDFARFWDNAHSYQLRPGPFIEPGSLEALGRRLMKQPIDRSPPLVFQKVDRWPASQNFGELGGWETTSWGFPSDEQAGVTVIRSMVEEGALRLWMSTNPRTKQLEPYLAVDKSGMEAWQAARLIMMSDEDP